VMMPRHCHVEADSTDASSWSPRSAGRRTHDAGVRHAWGWRGAHRGAGTTTLARRLGGADLGLVGSERLPTLVVCRASIEGLIAAQQLAADELASGPAWTCLGLVIVAAGKARPSKAVAELMSLIVAGYPASWPIAWEDASRPPSPADRAAPACRTGQLRQLGRPLKHRPTKEQGR
jgi:hypothetical protein